MINNNNNNNKNETPEGRHIDLLRKYIDDVDNDLKEIGAEIASHKEAQKERYEERDTLDYLIAKLQERIVEKRRSTTITTITATAARTLITSTERAVITVIRDLEREHGLSFATENDVIETSVKRDRINKDPMSELSADNIALAGWNIKAIIRDLILMGVLYRPAKGLIARVER